ncbi:type II toxin-antitoxin system RelE/ParE family toxin [Ornithinicoccus hortensis]|uniref:type II toxin-antitoxin system RelE/ParE family toxin n=1 Tax=Ornithinicoccus hortensis TaxID=82346 RepID=UPI001478E4DD
MILRAGFHPEALRELDDAIQWYDKGGQGRGARFRADYDQVVDRCMEWRESAPVVPVPGSDRTFRHARVPRSHYRFVFYVADDVLKVVAVAHQRRRPLCWADRDSSAAARPAPVSAAQIGSATENSAASSRSCPEAPFCLSGACQPREQSGPGRS